MNCLRMSPGTVRKPGAILRKCSAQALRSILDGRRNWTIAVIIGRSSLRIASGDLSTRLVELGSASSAIEHGGRSAVGNSHDRCDDQDRGEQKVDDTRADR